MGAFARRFAIAGLAVSALAVASFCAWALYVRATWTFAPGYLSADRASQSYWERGLRILTQHEHFVPGVIAALVAAVAAGVLVVVIVRRSAPWAYLVAAVGALAAIAGPWLVRHQVWEFEMMASHGHGKWVARSPYVHRATQLAIALTVWFSLLAVASLVAWLSGRGARDT